MARYDLGSFRHCASSRRGHSDDLCRPQSASPEKLIREGETFTVETNGLNDQTWLDDGGYPHSEALRVTERFHRSDFGHMEIRITIDDPESYTRPWTVTIPKLLMADTELIEFMCENEKDLAHLVGK